MDNLSKYIDIYFLLLVTEIFVVITIITLGLKNIEILDYCLLGIVFLIIIISYLNGVIIGLLASFITLFGYGTYMIYMSIIQNASMEITKYAWLIIFPISAYLSGNISMNIKEMQETSKKLEDEIQNLVTIDEVTGLNNTKSFYVDLNNEMSKAKRHKFDLTVLIIKVEYYEQVKSLIGIKNVESIIKKIGESVEIATRIEDERYKIREDMFAIVMPNTNLQGGELIRNRVKKDVENINLTSEGKEKKYKLDVKIGLVQYEEKIENSFEFRKLAEKELEFDV